MKKQFFSTMFTSGTIARLIVLLIFTSCSEDTTRILSREFPVTHELTARKIPIKEVLNPIDLIKTTDYFIFQNEYVSGEDCFFVFDRALNFCYSFGRLGQGPQEYIAPRLIYGAKKDNQVSIIDSQTDIITEFKLEALKPRFISETQIAETYFPTQYISYVNDSILAYEVQNNDGSFLYSYNLSSKRIVDTLVFATPFKKMMNSKFNPNIEDFKVSINDATLLTTFNFINEVRIGTILKDGKFEMDKTFSSDNCELNSIEDIDSNTLFYLFPQITEKYVYAPYYGLPFLSMKPFPFNLKGRSMMKHIEVYDLEKKPIARLSLDGEFLKFIIDEKAKKLYTWDFLKDFDYLLEYDISCLHD